MIQVEAGIGDLLDNLPKSGTIAGPATLAIFAFGLVGLGMTGWRRKLAA